MNRLYLGYDEVQMKKQVAGVCLAVMAVSAMGTGGNPAPPSRINPPSPAEVDAAQAARPAVLAADPSSETTLRILPAAEILPEEFLWQVRPVVVFADTAADPAFLMQIQELQKLPAPLIDRDVVVITDTDPGVNTVWRQRFHPRGFSLVIIDKDGQVKQRKPAPWSVREITRAIDKFPLRREEIGRAGVIP